MYAVHSPETGHPIDDYQLAPNVMVFRWEPQDAPTPMSPHASPYAPYGPFEFGHHFLFMVEQRALDALTGLRKAQNYFTENVVLRSATVGDLMQKYPRGKLLADYKFNMTVLEGQDYARGGALILASPYR